MRHGSPSEIELGTYVGAEPVAAHEAAYLATLVLQRQQCLEVGPFLAEDHDVAEAGEDSWEQDGAHCRLPLLAEAIAAETRQRGAGGRAV